MAGEARVTRDVVLRHVHKGEEIVLLFLEVPALCVDRKSVV